MVAIGDELLRLGADVRYVAPAPLALLLRSHGLSSYGTGEGGILSALGDSRLLTSRFDGWDSWRQLSERFMAATLEADTQRISRILSTWGPNVIVTTPMAVAGRVAAAQAGIRYVTLSVLPQWERLGHGGSFGHHLRREVSRLFAQSRSNEEVATIAWGTPGESILLYEPLLLDTTAARHASSARHRAVGYPFWNRHQGPNDELNDLLQGTEQSAALLTLGSMVGRRWDARWVRLVESITALGVMVVIAGEAGRSAPPSVTESHLVQAIDDPFPYAIVKSVGVVVSHAGAGAIHGCMRAGCPSVFLPTAFDQPFGARLAESVGLGITSTDEGLATSVQRILEDSRFRRRAQGLARQMVPGAVATSSAVRFIVGT